MSTRLSPRLTVDAPAKADPTQRVTKEAEPIARDEGEAAKWSSLQNAGVAATHSTERRKASMKRSWAGKTFMTAVSAAMLAVTLMSTPALAQQRARDTDFNSGNSWSVRVDKSRSESRSEERATTTRSDERRATADWNTGGGTYTGGAGRTTTTEVRDEAPRTRSIDLHIPGRGTVSIDEDGSFKSELMSEVNKEIAKTQEVRNSVKSEFPNAPLSAIDPSTHDISSRAGRDDYSGAIRAAESLLEDLASKRAAIEEYRNEGREIRSLTARHHAVQSDAAHVHMGIPSMLARAKSELADARASMNKLSSAERSSSLAVARQQVVNAERELTSYKQAPARLATIDARVAEMNAQADAGKVGIPGMVLEAKSAAAEARSMIAGENPQYSSRVGYAEGRIQAAFDALKDYREFPARAGALQTEIGTLKAKLGADNEHIKAAETSLSEARKLHEADDAAYRAAQRDAETAISGAKHDLAAKNLANGLGLLFGVALLSGLGYATVRGLKSRAKTKEEVGEIQKLENELCKLMRKAYEAETDMQSADALNAAGKLLASYDRTVAYGYGVLTQLEDLRQMASSIDWRHIHKDLFTAENAREARAMRTGQNLDGSGIPVVSINPERAQTLEKLAANVPGVLARLQKAGFSPSEPLTMPEHIDNLRITLNDLFAQANKTLKGAAVVKPS